MGSEEYLRVLWALLGESLMLHLVFFVVVGLVVGVFVWALIRALFELGSPRE
jgi:hypothetical protein